MNTVTLPWPADCLWPNGPNSHRMKVARQRGKARESAWALSKVAQLSAPETRPITVQLVIHPKPRGPLPDADNCVAACKAYFDGIADALGVNDRDFVFPPVEFRERRKGGAVVVEIAA